MLASGGLSVPSPKDAASIGADLRALGMPAPDASTYWKTGASFAVGLAGMFYLGVGRRQNDVQKIVIGLALTLASFLLF